MGDKKNVSNEGSKKDEQDNIVGLKKFLENKFSSLENRFTGLENRVSGLENRFSGLENKIEILNLGFQTMVKISSASPGNLESIPMGQINDPRGYKSKRMRWVPKF